MSELCLSSELYPIAPADLAVLEDGPAEYRGRFKNEIVVLIGDSHTGQIDTLVCGREKVVSALKNGTVSVPVRIAFISKIRRFDFITVFVKPLRSRYKIFSSNIYHIDPVEIRRMKIERNIRTRENAYIFSNPLFYYDEQERKRQYNELYESMKKGYNDEFPIDIMLLRMMGIKDTVNQGHHRMGIALECRLPQVAVRFSAAGSAPKILQPLLKVIADINITLKLWNKK